MPYRPVAYKHISDEVLREDIFQGADWLLSDTYHMFNMQPSSGTGGGNWSIALVLLCVIDGISLHVYPTDALARDQDQRFKRLIREKLPWGPISNKLWYPIHNAAAVLYTEFRNTLVHELAIDKPTRARFKAGIEKESGISKWGPVPERFQNIDAIDEMTTWNGDWPTLSVEPHEGGKRLKLSCAGFYWAVKRMVNELAADSSTLNEAVEFRSQPKPPKSLLERLCSLLRR
jgi:hypothetical protein